jgi:hypothetical protein
MLGSPNDQEVLTATRGLVRALADASSDLTSLGRVWDARPGAQPKPKAQPLDFTKIEAAVTRYVADKTGVTHNNVVLAVRRQVVEFRDLERINLNAAEQAQRKDAFRYIDARLRALGFRPNASGATWSRPGQED